MPVSPLHVLLPSPRRLLAALGCTLAVAAIGPALASQATSSPGAPSAQSPLPPSAVAFDRIAATDFSALKTSLEKAGWPASHVRALLGLEVQRRLNPDPVLRLEDLKPFHFWHTGPDALPVANLNTPELAKQRTEREELVRAKYDELFPHVETETGLLDRWEDQRRWGTLPTEKRAQVLALLESSGKARDEFLEKRGRMLNPQEWETLFQANRDARRRLEQILTADELLDYDLRNSNTATRMRTELDAFAPTREEFVALFRLRHPLELAFEDKPPGSDPTADAQRELAEKDSLQKIAALLGPERFDDYRISLDPVCQTLRFDARYARTDAATTRRLYRSFIDAKQRLAGLDAKPLPERETASASLKAELHREFRTVFDEEGTRRFLQEQSLWP